ncbi:MAG: glutamine-hydrolyzing carbamoyl-phosphate synthase small subunit [Actinomycetota bacterium]
MSEALLMLEDGTSFVGRSFGAEGETFGEIVFNTAMSGYQEVLTDPSYARQIVVMTYPHQGNYGVNSADPESGAVQVSGFAVREVARRPSNWRAEQTLAGYLEETGIVGIEGIDTRALTLHIREAGAMRAGISTGDLDPASLLERVRTEPPMLGADLAQSVSTVAPYEAAEVVGPAEQKNGRTFRVAAYDWGIKRNILRLLARNGCETTVMPALTPAADVLADGHDGVFLSNGPGDPAATDYAVEITRNLIGKLPVFGICLGHQIMGRALGGETFKLKFGHRGVNQPVLNLDTRRVEVTSHNHGFAVDPAGFGLPREVPREEAPVVETSFGRAALTHWNLNDATLEGLRLLDSPAFSVQYHPEAAPGPHDSRYLFDRFLEEMGAAAN